MATNPRGATAWLSAIGVAGLAVIALAGCAGPQPFIREGDATRVDVGYYGDVDTAFPLARQHCAAYQRVAHLSYSGAQTAYFTCDERQR